MKLSHTKRNEFSGRLLRCRLLHGLVLGCLLASVFVVRPVRLSSAAAPPPPPACSTASFGAATNFGTGSNTLPYSVAVGDFNGDSKLDLVTANLLAHNVALLLGNGMGSFGAATSFDMGFLPDAVAAADVNGDGKLDIITADAGDNGGRVSVRLGDGMGGFGARTFFNLFGFGFNTVEPHDIVASDLNGDGKLDLVTANFESDNAAVLLNNCGMPCNTPSFAAPVFYPTGANPGTVAVGDVNGDGKRDLVVTNHNFPWNVSVLLGNGNGTFQTAVNFDTNGQPIAATLGDVNGDGKPDLLVANDNQDQVAVLLNTYTAPTFNTSSFGTATSFNVGDRPQAIDTGDFDGDGKLDVVTANLSAGNVTVLLGNGMGGFGTAKPFAVAAGPRWVAARDFNGDGKPDLVTPTDANNVSVLLNNCTPNQAPTITALAVARNAGAGASNSAIATVNDAEDAENTLGVTATVLDGSGVTVSNISVDSSGNVTADVAASCTATATARFTLRVTDSAGSSATATLTVTVPPINVPLTITVTPTEPTCNGATNGGLAISVIHGTGPFQYSINDGATFSGTATFTGLGAGTYPVIVKDAYDCNRTARINMILGQPAAISFTTAPTAPACTGGMDGSLTINATGGTGAKQYSINNGASFSTTPTFTGLSAGTYPVIVKDANNCQTVAANVTLTPPAALTFTTTPVNPSCNGGTNGSLTINAMGGTGVLQYSINNGQSFSPNAQFTGLGAGIYPVIVKDANNCQTAAANATLTQPSAITFNVTPVAPTCNGGMNGSLTINATGGTGALQYSINSGASFQTSNTFAGLAAGVSAVVVKDANGCPTLPQNFTVTQPAALGLSPAALPGGVTGQFFTQTFTASGGTGPKTVSLQGALPPWLNFNPANATLSGTAPQPATVSFTLVVTDQANCTARFNYTLNFVCSTLTLTPTTLPNGVQGTTYHQTLAVNLAGGNYSYAVTTNILPPGLMLNSATGALTGIPTAPGNYTFIITVTGWGTCTKSQSYNVAITGTCAPIVVSPTSLSAGALGIPYAATVSAAGGTAPHTYSVSTGALPAGLTLNASTGELSGTPTASGFFSFTLRALGQGGCSGQRAYMLSIGCGTLTFAPASLPVGSKGVAYSQQLAVIPATSAMFSVLLGSLPPGLTLNSAGLLSGTTTQTGTYNITVKALVGSCQGTKAYSLVIGTGTAALALSGDYDGDGKSDPALWSANDGTWRIVRSSNGQAINQRWGTAGDVTLLGDYDGDGKTDLAVFRPADATFYVKRSSDGQYLVKQWGLSTDVPVPGDYDGDGRTDLAVWRGANGTWYIVRSSDGQYDVQVWGAGYAPYQDVPVTGDYDGDGKSDVAVFRRGNGTWLIKFSAGRSLDGQYAAKQWGLGTDVPVAGDYDGDGQTDYAVWRGVNGGWYIWQSASNSYRAETWGTSAAPSFDQAAPGDYDGDGKADWAVWRAGEQAWYVRGSQNGSVMRQAQGQTGDRAVAVKP